MDVLFGILGLALLIFMAAGLAFVVAAAVAVVCSGIKSVIARKRGNRW